MKLSDFSFEYPEELVAQAPLSERDQSRLLVWNDREQQCKDSAFVRIADELRSQLTTDPSIPVLLLVNDSKVYPARVRTVKESGARGEVFILSPHLEKNISCLLRPLKKMRVGDVLLSEHSRRPVFRVSSIHPPAVENISGGTLQDVMNGEGEMPLPPYIVRDPARVSDPSVAAMDRMRYQTVYAREAGSAAAPTAGLHFTPAVLSDCAEKKITIAGVTLHVGLGTFQPVTRQDIDDHEMHTELCCIPKTTMLKILEHTEHGWPIVFVGTTAFRTVESVMLNALGVALRDACRMARGSLAAMFSAGVVRKEDILNKADEWIATDLFIRPSDCDFIYRPVCGDGMITNFHQPESTLAMLIASLVGYTQWQTIYQHAISSRYRLFSYGDSSLLIFRGVS
jgi:S-adenosylmethionine:tRNA ribosyltransferase-isomerase